jgi:uncharacterized protein (DUF433 family)
MDWLECSLVESNPLKLGGAPILRGTRVPVSAIIGNFESGSPIEEISENFGIPEEKIRQILSFYESHRAATAFR